MRAQSTDYFFGAEAGCRGVRQHARDERAQALVVFLRRPRFLGGRGHERSDAAPRLDRAAALEIRVDARDGIGVDLQLDRQLADSWELVAGLEPGCRHRRPERPLLLR